MSVAPRRSRLNSRACRACAPSPSRRPRARSRGGGDGRAETVAASGGRPVPLVELADRRRARREERLVLGQALRRRVRPVREEREAELGVRIGEVVDLQALDSSRDLGLVGRELGTRPACAGSAGTPPRARAWAAAAGPTSSRDEPVDESDREIRGRARARGARAATSDRAAAPAAAASDSGDREDRRRSRARSAQVAAASRARNQRAAATAGPGARKPSSRLQRGAAPGDQVVAGVGRRGRRAASSGGEPRRRAPSDGAARDLELVMTGSRARAPRRRGGTGRGSRSPSRRRGALAERLVRRGSRSRRSRPSRPTRSAACS